MKKLLLVLMLLSVAVLLLFFDFSQYASIDQLQMILAEKKGQAMLIFFLVFLLVAGLSLPGTGPLTVSAGFLFGFGAGLLLVSFASSIGAMISFLTSRALLRDWIQHRFPNVLKTVNDGIAKDGLIYLFSLRLVPVVPFFLVNPIVGLTRMPVVNFYLVSQVGMFPLSALYVNLGTSLGSIEELDLWRIFTPQVVISLIALIVFPFIFRYLIEFVKGRAKKPKRESVDAE